MVCTLDKDKDILEVVGVGVLEVLLVEGIYDILVAVGVGGDTFFLFMRK